MITHQFMSKKLSDVWFEFWCFFKYRNYSKSSKKIFFLLFDKKFVLLDLDKNLVHLNYNYNVMVPDIYIQIERGFKTNQKSFFPVANLNNPTLSSSMSSNPSRFFFFFFFLPNDSRSMSSMSTSFFSGSSKAT